MFVEYFCNKGAGECQFYQCSPHPEDNQDVVKSLLGLAGATAYVFAKDHLNVPNLVKVNASVMLVPKFTFD